MAPTSAWNRLARLGVIAALVAGCTGTPEPRTTASNGPSPSASPSPAPHDAAPSPLESLPGPPDLSGTTIDCDTVEEPCDRGDDPDLDRLWDACAAGAGGACDRLYYDSGFDTRYEQFGNTCGDRGLVVPCPRELDDTSG